MNLAQELYEELPEPVDAPEYKRAFARRKIDIPIEIELDGRICREIAMIRDVTPTSIGLVCKIALPDRKRVRVRRDENSPWSDAVVVHCASTIGAYKIGLEMVSD